MKNKVGQTSSTILNSSSFQRYRPLSVKASSFFSTHPLEHAKKSCENVKILGCPPHSCENSENNVQDFNYYFSCCHQTLFCDFKTFLEVKIGSTWLANNKS